MNKGSVPTVIANGMQVISMPNMPSLFRSACHDWLRLRPSTPQIDCSPMSTHGVDAAQTLIPLTM